MLMVGLYYVECNFDRCCFYCFLKGEIYRLKEIRRLYVIVNCCEELYNYFDYNIIFIDEYFFVGMLVEEVERVVMMIKLLRSRKDSRLLREILMA